MQAAGELWAFSLTDYHILTRTSGFGKVRATCCCCLLPKILPRTSEFGKVQVICCYLSLAKLYDYF